VLRLQRAAGNRAVARLLAERVRGAALVQRDRAPGTGSAAGAEVQAARRVIVIGAPSPKEIQARHPFQFVNAAMREGTGPGTVWLVERSGYEAAGIDLAEIQTRAGKAEVIWIDSRDDVIQRINLLPRGSIQSLQVYSHGLPGLVALRYGWEARGLPNYGITLEQVRRGTPAPFAPGASIGFDSCNTGTSDWAAPAGNLAQEYAQSTGRDVTAWTGRTSYADVNAGTGGVRASEKLSGRHPDFTEIGSQWFMGRDPKQKTFHPIRGPRVGGFQSTFDINLRLPQTRKFTVPAGGAVTVRCPDPKLGDGSQEPRGIGTFIVTLHRSEGFRDEVAGSYQFQTAPSSALAIWTGLGAGEHYLEIWRPDDSTVGLPLHSSILVDVYGP